MPNSCPPQFYFLWNPIQCYPLIGAGFSRGVNYWCLSSHSNLIQVCTSSELLLLGKEPVCAIYTTDGIDATYDKCPQIDYNHGCFLTIAQDVFFFFFFSSRSRLRWDSTDITMFSETFLIVFIGSRPCRIPAFLFVLRHLDYSLRDLVPFFPRPDIRQPAAQNGPYRSGAGSKTVQH